MKGTYIILRFDDDKAYKLPDYAIEAIVSTALNQLMTGGEPVEIYCGEKEPVSIRESDSVLW